MHRIDNFSQTNYDEHMEVLSTNLLFTMGLHQLQLVRIRAAAVCTILLHVNYYLLMPCDAMCIYVHFSGFWACKICRDGVIVKKCCFHKFLAVREYDS